MATPRELLNDALADLSGLTDPAVRAAAEKISRAYEDLDGCDWLDESDWDDSPLHPCAACGKESSSFYGDAWLCGEHEAEAAEAAAL